MLWKLRQSIRPFIVYVGSLLFGSEKVVRTIPFGPLKGKKLYMSFENGPLMWFGMTEAKLLHFAAHYIKPSDIVYDIGAHFGYTAIFFADLVKTNGEVHAWEMLPTTANEYLARSIAENSTDNVKIHVIGLADKPAELTVRVNQRRMGNIYNTGGLFLEDIEEKVIIDTLDNYIAIHKLPAPNFMKVDIEGAEVEFLQGAKKTITEFSPLMLIEFHTLPLLLQGFKILTEWGFIMQDENGRDLNDIVLEKRVNSAFVRETFFVQPKP